MDDGGKGEELGGCQAEGALMGSVPHGQELEACSLLTTRTSTLPTSLPRIS